MRFAGKTDNGASPDNEVNSKRLVGYVFFDMLIPLFVKGFVAIDSGRRYDLKAHSGFELGSNASANPKPDYMDVNILSNRDCDDLIFPARVKSLRVGFWRLRNEQGTCSIHKLNVAARIFLRIAKLSSGVCTSTSIWRRRGASVNGWRVDWVERSAICERQRSEDDKENCKAVKILASHELGRPFALVLRLVPGNAADTASPVRFVCSRYSCFLSGFQS